MSDGFDDIMDSVRYRLVFGTAWRIAEPRTFNSRVFDTESPRDVADLRTLVLAELGTAGETIPPGLVREAVDDAIRGRRPRW